MCFTNKSEDLQGDSNKKDIIDFNMDKVIKELNDSLIVMTRKIKQLKEILLLVLIQTRITSIVIPKLYITTTSLRIQLI